MGNLKFEGPQCPPPINTAPVPPQVPPPPPPADGPGPRYWDAEKGMWVIPAIPPEVSEQIMAIKKEIREEQCPYFKDEDFLYYLRKNCGDVNKTIYEMLIIKSEDTSISISGYSSSDTSSYFKRLASKYIKRNSGCI